MNSNSPFKPLLLLANSDAAISRFSLETSYGLVLAVRTDGSVTVRLADDSTPEPDTAPTNTPPPNANAPEHTSEPKGYRYYIWPDYKTNFVWYTADWPGNPEGEDAVLDEDLAARYPASWTAALGAWVGRYTGVFEAQERHLATVEGRLFADPEQRTAWLLEGMLLSCWLALQPGVDAVSYQPAETDVAERYVVDKRDVDAALGRFLGDLRAIAT